jgi:hypothetical protein
MSVSTDRSSTSPLLGASASSSHTVALPEHLLKLVNARNEILGCVVISNPAQENLADVRKKIAEQFRADKDNILSNDAFSFIVKGFPLNRAQEELIPAVSVFPSLQLQFPFVSFSIFCVVVPFFIVCFFFVFQI